MGGIKHEQWLVDDFEPHKNTPATTWGDNITHKSDIKQKDMGANLGDVYLCCIIQS